MIQVQLDKTIETEGKLMADINNLSAWTTKSKRDNKRLERKRRKGLRAPKHCRQRAENNVSRLHHLQAQASSTVDSTLDAEKNACNSQVKGQGDREVHDLPPRSTVLIKPSLNEKEKDKM